MAKKSDAATPAEIAQAQELFAREAKMGARVLTWGPLVRAKKPQRSDTAQIAFAEETFARDRKKGARVLTSGVYWEVCSIANRCSLSFHNGDPATCVLTAGAVWQVLDDFGIPARVIRVKAFVWPIKG